MSLFRSVFRTKPEHVTDDVRSHIEFARSLQDAGNCVVQVIRYVPTLGMVHFSGTSAGNSVYAKLMAFQVGAGQYPVLHFSQSESREWYDYFVSQIDSYFVAVGQVVGDGNGSAPPRRRIRKALLRVPGDPGVRPLHC